MGAARLAQICVDGGQPAEVCEAPPVARRISPNHEIAERLAPKRADFIAAYPGIASRKVS
jgi:xylulokinase